MSTQRARNTSRFNSRMERTSVSSAILKIFPWSRRVLRRGYGVDNFYVHTASKKVISLFHRTLRPEWKKIDHTNREPLDNRRSNLRDGSGPVNNTNQAKRRDNTSGITGGYCSQTRAWVAQIQINGRHHRQFFREEEYDDAKEEAIAQRQAWAKEAGNTNGE